jgi:iron complex transport system substrate-binding protein
MRYPHKHTLGALAASVVVAMVALTGCSGNMELDASGPMRPIKDVDDKSIDVPMKPKRVVTLSEPTTDAALALGAKPIGIVSGRGQSTVSNYLKDKGEAVKGGDLEILGGVANPDYEKIGAAKPDLILVDGTSINNNQQALDKLAAIAPLVYTGYAGGPWKDNFRLTAKALNEEAKAESLISGYDKRTKEVSGELKSKGLLDKTYSIVRWEGGSASLILKELPPGQALTDMGMKRPKNQDMDGRGHSEPVSLENIKDIDADYMYFGSLGGASISNPNAGGGVDVAAGQEQLRTATGTPGFSKLQAFGQNHVFPVDGSMWTSTGSYYLMNAIVDNVEDLMIKEDAKGQGRGTVGDAPAAGTDQAPEGDSAGADDAGGDESGIGGSGEDVPPGADGSEDSPSIDPGDGGGSTPIPPGEKNSNVVVPG